MDESIIFESYISHSATVFKTIIELFSHIAPTKEHATNLKKIFFKISKAGIVIYNMESESLGNIIAVVSLSADHFCNYNFNFTAGTDLYAIDVEELNMSVSLDIMKEIFKTFKISKNDGFAMRISKAKNQLMPNEIVFSISSNGEVSAGSVVKFSNTQNIVIDDHLDGIKLSDFTTGEFQRICKEMGNAKQKIKILANNKSLILSYNILDIATKWISYSMDCDTEFDMYLKSEHIRSLSKVATLASKNIELHLCKDNTCLMFKTLISNTKKKYSQDIGELKLWITSTQYESSSR